MKNAHLVPINVVDLADKLAKQDITETERLNYIMRLEAISEYCEYILNQMKKKDEKRKVK